MNGQDDFNWAAPPPPPPESEPGALSQKEWIIIVLLQTIPCVNVIMMLVWAFSSGGNPTRKRVAEAWLIVSVCVMAISFILNGVGGNAISSLLDSLANYRN
ncbi:MAG: hypothetical protein LBT59_02990 [Clostridiales bacterium]|jgi:hypothetical protein|nr:hypothetical protein [Clostridiales bacterium]